MMPNVQVRYAWTSLDSDIFHQEVQQGCTKTLKEFYIGNSQPAHQFPTYLPWVTSKKTSPQFLKFDIFSECWTNRILTIWILTDLDPRFTISTKLSCSAIS